MYSSITRNKSDWDGKIDAGMNGRERESACLLVLPPFSLPRMPLWPEIQRRVIGIRIVVKVVIRLRIPVTRGCEENDFKIVRKVARSQNKSEWDYRGMKRG